MAVKYDGIGESGLNSLNDQEVVSRAKQKLKSDLEAGMVSIDQAMELVNNMKTIEQMSPESNVPQYSMSTLSKIKAAYDKPYIEAQKAAEKAAKAAQSSSKSSKSKDEEEAEAEALYQKMMGGENAQSSTNANSAADSTKTDKPAEKEEPEKEKGFLAKAADWLKNAFSKAEQKAFTEDSENSQKQVLSAHPQQQGQGFANIVANAAKQAPTVIKNAVREQGVKATRQQALDAGYSERQADLKAEAFRKMLEENDKEKELKKQTDAVLSQRWEADYGAMLDDLSQTDRDIIKQLSQIENELDNGTTGGYQHVQYLKKMSDSYRDTLEQHGISGLDLDELVRYQQAQTDNQNTAQAKKERQDYVNEGAGNAALASGRSILEGTVGNIGGYADILAQKADRLITGSKAPVNTNSQAQLASNLADTTRQQVSGNIADTVYQETGNEFLSQLAANGYQLGMSGADSLAALPLSFVSGGGATVALGLGAANQGFKQAKAQGATDNQALAYGTLAGAAEGLFEKFSLDNIKAMARTDKKGLSNFFLNTLKSMGVEGSEEALTQISNDFSEMLVLGDNSTLQQVYNDVYARAIAEGLSEAEAQERAWTAQYESLWQDVGAAALGGAAMGGVMGGGTQLIGKAARGIRNQFTGEPEATSDPLQPNAEDSLPSLSDQPAQATDNPAKSGAVIQDAEQILPGLGDPVSENAGIQNQGLTDIDPGEGNFPESQENFSQTKSQGSVNKVVGNSGKTFVDGKTPLDFTYAVMSADDIIPSNTVNGSINANYPAELQPRDRTRQSSKAQIADISANLNPALLEESATAQNGAPIVRDDGVVIGGNGRTLAILQAYDANAGTEYAEYIRQNARRFGIDPASIPKNPILVRVATGVSDYADLARKLNASSTADYSSTESGMTDADKISADLLDILAVNEDGNLNTAENKPFISRFINDVVPSSERNSMFASDGSLSQTGLARIQQAVFAKAYGSTDLLARLSESLDNDSKNVTNALLAVAPKAAQINNDIANNTLYNVDVVNGILNSVDLYLTAKKQDLSSEDLASQIRFDGKTWDAGEVWLAQYLQANKRSSKKIRDMFNALCDELEGYGDPNQVSLFGDNQIPSLREIYEGAAQKYENQSGADAGQPDYERFGERDSTFNRNGETGKNTLPVFEPGTESGGESGNNESVNPSIGAAGRGFSWGGEGVAGQEVPSQSNTINNIDRANLSDIDMEIQGGEQSYTHERVTHKERMHEAENVLSTETVEEVMDRLAGKAPGEWDADDMAAAIQVNAVLDKQMSGIQDKSSDEYRTLLLEKSKFSKVFQQARTSTGQALEIGKAIPLPDQALMNAQKAIQTATERAEKKAPKKFKQDEKNARNAVSEAKDEALNDLFGDANKSPQPEAGTTNQSGAAGAGQARQRSTGKRTSGKKAGSKTGNAKQETDTSTGEWISTIFRDSLYNASRKFRDTVNRSLNSTPQQLSAEELATNEIVKQLQSVYLDKVSTKAKTAREKPSALDSLRLAVQNQDAYKEVWRRAQDALRVQYALDPQKLSELVPFLEYKPNNLYDSKVFSRAVTQFLVENDISLKEVADRSAFGSTTAVDTLARQITDAVAPPEAERQTVMDNVKSTIADRKTFARMLQNADGRVFDNIAKALGIDFREIIKDARNKQEALSAMQESISRYVGASFEQSSQIAAQVYQRFEDKWTAATEQRIRQMFPELSGRTRKPSAPIDHFLEVLRMGAYDDAEIKSLVAAKYGVAPLSTEQTSQILSVMDEAERLPENSKRRVDLESQAAAIAASNVKSSWSDKWDAWRYTAMLGNIRTNVKNAGGNISMGMEARAKDVVLAAAEKAADAISKAAGKNGIQRTTSVLNPLSATDRALTGKAFADADENAYRPLTSTSEIFDIAKSSKGQGRVYQGNFLEGLRTASTRALEGGDYSGTLGMLEALDETKLKAINAWVKAGVEKLGDKGFIGVSGLKNNYAYSLASYLKANGYDSTVFDLDTPETRNILEKARAHAIQQALVNTYHADSALADAISDFKRKLSNSESVGGRIAGKVAEGFLPFVKTPVNVINNAIHYSPISFLKLASLDVVGIKKGTKTVNDALEDFASGLTGSLLMAIGAWMYQKGFLVPGMDEDEAKQSKSTGRQEYSLRLPNEDGSFSNYGIDWLTSSAIPLFTGAEWAKLNNGEATGDFLNDSITSLSSIAEPVVNMSLMQGVENALSAVEYAETNKTGAFLASAATSYVTQGIPTISGQIARGIDDTRRSTYSDKTGASGDIAYTQNKIENKLPGLSMTNEPYIDPWGRTESNGGLLYNLLSPGYYSREEMTDVDKALDALYQESESASVLPSLADKKLKLDGEERNLTPEEYTEFATERGQTAYDLLGSLTGSDMFEDMSTEDQVEAVSSMYSLADALAADAQFGNSYEPSSTNQKLMDAYNANGTNGVVSYLSAKNSIVGTGSVDENGKRSVTQDDKYRAYTDYAGPADEAVQNYLIAYPSDEKVAAAYKQFGGTVAQTWMKYKMQVDTNGNDSISQAEAKVWLNHSNLTQTQKAFFWQNTNSQWEKRNNPFL